MAKLVRKGSGWYIVTEGGERNGEVIAPDEYPVSPPVNKVDEFTWVEKSTYGRGVHTVKVYEDDDGRRFAIHRFTWTPNPGYRWEEYWERIETNVDELLKHKVLEEQPLN